MLTAELISMPSGGGITLTLPREALQTILPKQMKEDNFLSLQNVEFFNLTVYRSYRKIYILKIEAGKEQFAGIIPLSSITELLFVLKDLQHVQKKYIYFTPAEEREIIKKVLEGAPQEIISQFMQLYLSFPQEKEEFEIS